MQTALLLIRTPFQAHIAKQVLWEERIQEYDLLYITAHNSYEDISYFNLLSQYSARSQYIFISNKKPDILWHILVLLKSRRWLFGPRRNLVLLGSIDSLSIRTIVSWRKARIVTLDDGSANVSQVSSYTSEIKGKWRNLFYSWLFRSMTAKEVCEKSSTHYTIFPGLENIVQRTNVKPLSTWASKPSASSKDNQGSVTFFLGSPFSQSINPDQIARLQSQITSMHLDYYVQHPRETSPIASNVPLLHKNGQIAEDAIISISCGRPITLISHFSTVMLTLSHIASHRVFIFFRNDPRSADYLEVVEKLEGSPIRLIYL